MTVKHKGDLLKDKEKKGKKMWENETDKDLLKSEGPTGDPLWKNSKKKLNEKKKYEEENLNEGN